MAVVPVKNLGDGGINKDAAVIGLPPNIFTDARNVRFRNGAIETILGESNLFAMTSLNAEMGIHWPRPDVGYNVFANDGVITRVNASGAESNLLNSVSADYTDSVWQADLFGGGYAVIFNNGKSTPLYALYEDPSADAALIPFPGWNYIPGTTITASVVRSFNYSIVAANLTITTGSTVVAAPGTIRISTQAPIGGFPTTWEPGLTTDTADEFEVSTRSPIVDMRELRGSMMVYSSTSIHALTLNNGVAGVRPYSDSYGVLNKNCIAEFNNQHFVVDRNDIYTHNGSGKIESLVEGRMRDFFLNDLNPLYVESTFVVHNARYKEVWVCYASLAASNSKCNKALVYSYLNNTFTVRDLPGVIRLFPSPKLIGGVFRYGTEILLGVTGATTILQMDSTYNMINPTTGVAAPFQSYIERTSLTDDDLFGYAMIGGITPVFQVNETEAFVEVIISSQNNFDRSPDFANTSGRDLFTIYPKSESQGYKVDPRCEGRFMNLRIQSIGYWRLSYLGLNIEKPTARR